MTQKFLSDILIARGFPKDAFHRLPEGRSVQLHAFSNDLYLRSSLRKYRKKKETWIRFKDIADIYEFQFVDEFKFTDAVLFSFDILEVLFEKEVLTENEYIFPNP